MFVADQGRIPPLKSLPNILTKCRLEPMPAKVRHRLLCLGVVLFCLACVPLAGAADMPLKSNMDGVETTPWTMMLADPSGRLTIDQVRQAPYADRFKPFKNGRTYLGVAAGAWWLRLDVKNESDREQSWLVQSTSPRFDWAELYFFPAHGEPSRLLMGDHAPFANRPIAHRTNLFPIKMAPGQTASLYVRLSYEEPAIADVRLRVWSIKQFSNYAGISFGIVALMLGGFVIIALFNLTIAFSTRAPEYFWYVVYVISVALSSMAYHGLGYRFLWHEWPWITDLAPALFPGLTLVFSTQFTRSFLKLRQSMPRMDKLLRAIMLFTLAVLPLLVLGLRKIALFLFLGNTAVGLIFPFLGLKLWLSGQREARFYTIAWTAWLVSIALSLVRYMGLTPLTMLMDVLPAGFMLCEALLLSLALADRIKVLREQKEAAEKKYLDGLKRAKEELERQVSERTAEIKRMHRQAVEAARTDMLTGLPNRRAFYSDGAREMERAARYGRPVSLIMLDLDRFKQVNDTHGHSVGDEVLKHLAAVLQREKRVNDLVGRLGGEEFALILPETSEEEAAQIAQRLRQGLAAQPYLRGGAIIRVSASFGVTRQRPGDSIETLLDRADKALYQAKEAGRDQVAVA